MTTQFNDYIQLPPDGGGKRTHANVVLMLNYNSAAGNTFTIGDRVTGVTSNFVGDVLFSVVINSNTGALALRPIFGSTVFETILGEDLNVNGSFVAKADDAGIKIYNQNINISSVDNPFNCLTIDKRGAAYVRFDEGPQQLDAFGLTRTSTPTQLDDYNFEYGDNTEKYHNYTNGTASITPILQQSSMELSVGSANSDRAVKTTNRYHLYQAGYSQLTEMTVVIGDSGKTNCVRRWGYFDDNNGMFFELNGTDLNVVIRSNVTGVVIDTAIPRDEWNRDKVDGSLGHDNISQETLDITNLNLYWMDVQWLGGGKSRFGVYLGGKRITLHVENHGNEPIPFMQTGTLPLRWEILNTGVTAGASTMKVVCATVKTEGHVTQDFQKNLNKYSFITPEVVLNGSTSGEYYLCTFRSIQTINTKTNRKISVPELFNFHVVGGHIIFRMYKNAEINNANFEQVEDSAVEVDTNGELISFGKLMFPMFISEGCYNIDAPSNFGYLGQHLRLDADGSSGVSYTITVEPILSTGTEESIVFGMTWIDMG